MKTRFAAKVLSWSTSIAITFAMIEIGLRILPGAIPLGLLKKFEPGTRLEIAQRRGLPNLSQIWVLPRDDNGPELKLFKPFTSHKLRHRDDGTVEAVDLDGNGFCNPLPDGGYAAPKIDILTIGDSFTACTGTTPEITWTSQLSEILDRPTYNLGRGGIGTYEYIQILKHFGLSKQPDAVVMNIYEGNDLRDAIRYWAHADPTQPVVGTTLDRRARARVDNVLGRHSYAYNLLAASLAQGWREVGWALDSARGRPTPRGKNFRYRVRLEGGDVPFNESNADSDEVDFAFAVVEGRIDLGVFDAALESFVQIAAQYGFRPVVAYSPSAHTAYANEVVFEDPEIAAPLAGYSRALRSYLARSAEELGFVFVDSTRAFQAAAAKSGPADLLYFPTNLHYTPAGHRVFAETVARSFESNE